MKVWPNSEAIRRRLKHPNGVGFDQGPADWPDDRFTRRRIRDGSVSRPQERWIVGAGQLTINPALPTPSRAPIVNATVELAELTLSAANFVEGSTAGTVIGTIQNKTAGSTIAVTPEDARVAVSGNNLVVGSVAAQDGTFDITLRETYASALNSPRDTLLTITVTEVVWPPEGDDLEAVLQGTSRIWHEPFEVLSLRTGGFATGSLTTGYNAPSSRGTWSVNGENFMTHSQRYRGLNSYSYTPNHAYNWQAIDPTFPPLGMCEITADGLLLRATGDYPAIRATLPLISGNVPYLSSFISTASSAKFTRPYVMRVIFRFMTMGPEEFPAIWTTGEHYALDIDDPTFKHYEVDLIERFGADYASDVVSIHTHINGSSRGGQYDTNVPLGPDVENEITILHTEEHVKAWFNGVLRTTMVHPVGQQYPNDRDHVELNQLIGMTWRAYTATHPDALLLIRSVEVFKPATDTENDLIPPTPPVPVLSGFAGTLTNGVNPDTVVGTLSGAVSYRVIGYSGLTVSGSNLVTTGTQSPGDYFFYIEGLAADGTPGIPPGYDLTVTGGAPALSSPSISATEATTVDIAVTTDTATGTLYWILDTDGTTTTKEQIKLGNMADGSPALRSGSVAVSAAGVQSIAGTISGLTIETSYVAQFMHEDALESAIAKSAATSTFMTDAVNFYSLFSTPATAEVKKLINDFVVGLKADDNWDALDGIQIYAMKPDLAGGMVEQVSLLDMRTPSRVPTATGAPTLTSGVGFDCDGIDDMINTGIIPSAGPNFTLNSAYVGYWSTLSDVQSGGVLAAGTAGNQTTLGPRDASNRFACRVNISSNLAGANNSVMDGSGYFAATRTAATAVRGYRNGGSAIISSSFASDSVTGSELQVARGFSGVRVVAKCACVISGGGRSQAQNQAIYDRLRVLMTALGVP